MEPLHAIPIIVRLLIAIAALVWDEAKEVIGKGKKNDDEGNFEKPSHSSLNILIYVGPYIPGPIRHIWYEPKLARRKEKGRKDSCLPCRHRQG